MNFIGQDLKKNGVDVETVTGAQTKATAAETNSKAYADVLSKFNIRDTREVDGPPNAYTSSAEGRKIHFEFKRIATIGLSGAGGTYCTLVTDGRWVGSSGGRKSQIALTDSGKIFTRLGSANEASWGAWSELETADSAQVKANQAELNAKAAIPTKLSQLQNDIGAGGGINITTSTTAPTSPSPGDFWYKEV